MRAKDKRKRSGWTGNVRSRDVGACLRLVPYWEKGANLSHRQEVIIDPGPSFGAGDHPTTIMALEFLEAAFADTDAQAGLTEVLDVGTGTGVLVIASILLGAEFAVGLDIDAAAIFTARRNVTMNGLARRVELFVGPLDAVEGPFPVVMANLAAPTLLKLRPQVERQVKRFLILSGIADAMVDQVMDAYTSGDLKLVSRRQRDGWNGALLRRE